MQPENQAIATVAELWRYPVKSMAGEMVEQLELDALGVVGDRRWAVRSSGAPRGKPLLSGAERGAMLMFHASVRDGCVRVRTPAGESFTVDDPRLLDAMRAVLPGGHALAMVESESPLTDVRPVAVLGSGTVAQLALETGDAVDPRRFRANLLLRFHGQTGGFAEDALVGRRVLVGDAAVLRITERTPRCRVVTLDPETAAADPQLMKLLDRRHDGRVGVYAAVDQPGRICVGDTVTLLPAEETSAGNHRPIL